MQALKVQNKIKKIFPKNLCKKINIFNLLYKH